MQSKDLFDESPVGEHCPLIYMVSDASRSTVACISLVGSCGVCSVIGVADNGASRRSELGKAEAMYDLRWMQFVREVGTVGSQQHHGVIYVSR